MNVLIPTLAACALLFGVSAQATEEHHPEEAKPPATTQTKPPSKPQARPSVAKPQGQMGPGMMEGMRAMQGQMEKIQKTSDPKERERLMQEHMKSMRENMAKMRGMGGGMMGAAGKGGDEASHHTMMEQRMDMMQMMMEQMLEHQKAVQGN